MQLRAAWVPVLVLVLAACSGGTAGPSEPHRLVDEGATLLDVRTPAEFASGHLPNAANIPVAELEARMSEVSEERPVVVYCRSGGRSARAAALLRENGYTVHDLGAMANW